MKTSVLIAFFLVVVLAVSYANASECADGDVKQVDCNTCKCTQGLWACTRKFCLKKGADECKPGDVKRVECNNVCRCFNGLWACTKIGCVEKRADECEPGQKKKLDCNTCYCLNGNWACTLMGCLEKGAIPARSDPEARRKRDMHVAEDLKDTPCAPNDYFQVDCNVCYCNLEHSGYLCTNNYCYNYDESTTVKIPLENDSMLILSSRGVKFIENASTRGYSPGRFGGKFGADRDETNNTDNELLWMNDTEQLSDASNQSVTSDKSHE